MGKIEYTNQIDDHDLIEMKMLWHDIFGDDFEYIDQFIEDVYDPNLTIIAKNDNAVVASLYMIEYSYVLEDITYKMLYLYALATKKEYRNQGIMSRLIEEAIQMAKKQKYDAMFLMPAEKSLIEYYQKFGFNNLIRNRIVEINSPFLSIQQIDSDYKIEDLTIENGIKKIICASKTGIVYKTKDINKLKLYLSSFIESGGRIIGLYHKKQEVAYAVLVECDKEVKIVNTNIEAEDIVNLENELEKIYANKEVVFLTPCNENIINSNLIISDSNNIDLKENNMGLLKIINKNLNAEFLVKNEHMEKFNLQFVLD